MMRWETYDVRTSTNTEMRTFISQEAAESQIERWKIRDQRGGRADLRELMPHLAARPQISVVDMEPTLAEVKPLHTDGHEGTRYEALPTTQQTRTVGQRRREAEEKLVHHLDEARHRDDHDDTADPASAGAEEVDGGDIAAIQNEDRPTAADRDDLIANHDIAEQERDAGYADDASAGYQADRPYTIAPGPAEEEDRREHDDRGLTTDAESSD